VKVFTTSDIGRLYGFSQRQLDAWDRSGFINPSIRRAAGKGTVRLYSTDDLLALRFIKRLLDAGWYIRTIKHAVNNLLKILPDKDPLRDLVLLDANGSILARCPSSAGETILLDALSSGQLVVVFTLSSLVSEVETDVMTLNRGQQK